ncbi:uncharacterized protein EAF01_003374 [Botrytis porri]|uniref:uncharacterized protein n=1 Tax=Botrytis porri TaxID=87229 RepID=UPI001900743C|nr:uncharacterized protein EAF01_003374 [Botrytis porri]KAF7909656.1 hypothetical protein EAF01_003374 [Botrytis porri]
MGWFGNQDLSAKFGIVLGGAIFIVLSAGLIKVWLNKRKLARNIQIEELEKANSTQERLNVEELGEGDLFGVRAIERGFFGGVSQSRSNSPAQSMFGSPSTTAVDLTETSRALEAMRGPSAASSSEISLSRRSSEVSAPKSIKHKPSPLRLQPSEAEIRRSALPNVGGSYIPPSPIKEVQPQSDSIAVQFGRTSASESPPSRTRSEEEVSQLHYQGEVPRNFMFLAGQHASVRSQAGSIYGSAEPSPQNQAKIPKIPTAPAPTHVFGFPSRLSGRPRSTSSEEESSSSDRFSSSSPELPVPAIPSPYKISYQPTTLLEQESNSKPRSYQPTQPSESEPQSDFYTHYREPSVANSILTTRTSILDDPSLSRSGSVNVRGRPAYKSNSRTPSAAYTHGQISRTHDSLRMSRKASLQTQEHRISRERDQMHYDPTLSSGPAVRNRSGSVQGRAVDFDRPRESPFSNANAIAGSEHDRQESYSSVSTASSRESSREGRGRSGSVGEEEWRGRGRGRSVVGETIVEVLTPMTSRGQRFDASDLV